MKRTAVRKTLRVFMALIGDPVREVEYAPLEGPLVSEPPVEPVEVDEPVEVPA